MLKVIKKIFSLLTSNQRKRFYALQLLVVLMSIIEIISIASVVPFMALVGDMSLLQQETAISGIYHASGISSESQFVFLLGAGVLIMLFVSSTISIFTTWRLSMYASSIGAEITDKLYMHYLKQDWLFHASGSSAQLTKKIATEALRVTNGIIIPLLQMNARIVLALFLSLTIFIYDPKVAITGLIVFAAAYLILFKLVRSRLQYNGVAISEVHEQRFRLMNEGFGGIKDVLLLGRDKSFIENFNKTGKKLAYSEGINNTLTQIPRYFIELIAFGSMMILLLYLISTHDGNLGMILPILSVYALATFKLLPAFQQIYASTAYIKANMAAFKSIQDDLINSSENKFKIINPENSYLSAKQKISLENITFTYPNMSEPVLNNLNLSIPINSTVGLVGPSGSGKSTLIDILLGLIEPQEGSLIIDKTIINSDNKRSWQNTIGYVAQSIFLSEGSFAENVAFGIPKDKIDLEKVRQSLELAHLTDLLQDLEKDIHTRVGERGVQLSGGQRQRLGIARALYHDAQVLVFDEATSSLDGVTEKIIMKAIHDFQGQKTIIMIAHRLNTVRQCDQLFFIDGGQVIDRGTYDDLIERNENFKHMASQS